MFQFEIKFFNNGNYLLLKSWLCVLTSRKHHSVNVSVHKLCLSKHCNLPYHRPTDLNQLLFVICSFLHQKSDISIRFIKWNNYCFSVKWYVDWILVCDSAHSLNGVTFRYILVYYISKSKKNWNTKFSLMTWITFASGIMNGIIDWIWIWIDKQVKINVY